MYNISYIFSYSKKKVLKIPKIFQEPTYVYKKKQNTNKVK